MTPEYPDEKLLETVKKSSKPQHFESLTAFSIPSMFTFCQGWGVTRLGCLLVALLSMS